MLQRHRFNPVFSGQGTTIFTVMSALALEHDAINLGQGFPDEDGPLAIREAAARALLAGPNQYAPMRGTIELRRAVSEHARRFYALACDPESEVLVTSGATEALAASILGLVGPGDEIVLIEPSYDSYRPIADAAGASVRSVTLEPPHWRLTEAALRAAVTGKTRAIVINSPLNPVGRVFGREELEAVARVAEDADLAVISDEVYEHLTFDGRPHMPLSCIPGMDARTVRIGSAGKMFSLTGWKIGWVTGPRVLVDAIAKAHQFLTFTTAPALQLGIAYALDREMDYSLALAASLRERRDLLAAGIAEVGFAPLACEGTYFLTADMSGLAAENETDRDFCLRLVREAGVALIPLSAFFAGGKPDHLVRFAFCKKRAVLEDALGRLEKYLKSAQARPSRAHSAGGGGE